MVKMIRDNAGRFAERPTEMLTLDLTNAPRWHDLAPGVRVQLRPLTTP